LIAFFQFFPNYFVAWETKKENLKDISMLICSMETTPKKNWIEERDPKYSQELIAWENAQIHN